MNFVSAGTMEFMHIIDNKFESSAPAWFVVHAGEATRHTGRFGS